MNHARGPRYIARVRAREILCVVGTRPEAIKMAPVVWALRARGDVRATLVATGQHRDLLRGALASLELEAEIDLDLMRERQTPVAVLARALDALEPVVRDRRPAALVVQGDTTSALAGALVGYHARVPVAHVEAGLRTYDHEHPFPEEGNRQLVDRLATWCFAPTAGARDNLLSEHIPHANVHVTGNTAVDAIEWAAARSTTRLPADTLLVTLHRRESFGDAMRAIVEGVLDFLDATPSARALVPIHPNESLRTALKEAVGDRSRLELIAPLPYVEFAGALATARLVLTDSGGIQEEAPSFGTPVLVARETTERPEALAESTNALVGRSRSGIATALHEAWARATDVKSTAPANPYGDGRSGERIARIMCGPAS